MPGDGVLARFIGPGGGGFELFLPRGWRIHPSKKLPRDFARGGWSGLKLSDTLHIIRYTFGHQGPKLLPL